MPTNSRTMNRYCEIHKALKMLRLAKEQSCRNQNIASRLRPMHCMTFHHHSCRLIKYPLTELLTIEKQPKCSISLFSIVDSSRPPPRSLEPYSGLCKIVPITRLRFFAIKHHCPRVSEALRCSVFTTS